MSQHLSLSFDWVENNDTYTAKTPYGCVVATALRKALSKYGVGVRQYRARIECNNGQIKQASHRFSSLGAVEGYAYLELQDYAVAERTQDKLDELIATIDKCRQLLVGHTANKW